jgi:beta-1,4-mannosyl-glycoprotein beta-1,4-N-acetylglucosaminyltransferase
MKIYDCFMFSDEKMVLDIRLNVLNKYIDHFIIVESKYKHDGTIKGKNFNLQDFEQFKNKITYIYLDEEPKNLLVTDIKGNEDLKNKKLLHNTYVRENSQRNMINEGIINASENDMIIIGDIDEIPKLEAVNFDNIKNQVLIFKQKMFYYKLNLFYKELVWTGSRACKKRKLKSPQWLRNIKNKKYPPWRVDTLFSDKKYFNINFIDDGGWHFTNMKTPEEIFLKLNSFLHNVDFKLSGLNLEDIKKMVKEKKILYDHFADQKKIDKWNSPVVLNPIEISFLPEYIRNNENKFKDWLE